MFLILSDIVKKISKSNKNNYLLLKKKLTFYALLEYERYLIKKNAKCNNIH